MAPLLSVTNQVVSAWVVLDFAENPLRGGGFRASVAGPSTRLGADHSFLDAWDLWVQANQDA